MAKIKPLNPYQKAALRWAARKADEWYGSITGDPASELAHKSMMKAVNDTLKQIGIRPIKARR